MPELLIEFLSEEIPARMQARAAEDLRERVLGLIHKIGFPKLDEVATYVTPRRLVAVASGLPRNQPDLNDERKGPRVGSPEPAIQGFLKSAGLSSLDQCEKRMVGKAEFYFVSMAKKGRPTDEVLAELLPEIVYGHDWPKSMRWANTLVRWVRPLHGVLAVFDGRPLAGAVGMATTDPNIKPISIPFSNQTVGHRFLAPQEFSVTGFADYQTKLRKAFVVLDREERKRLIVEQAQALAAKNRLALKHDPGLVDEVAGLVEWPVALLGRIDPNFLGLPPEVLAASMRTHQRYFALETPEGNLAPQFVVVANTEATDGGRAIIAGNERVLKARLSDAKYFWDHDRKIRLEERVPKLAGITFHAKLGSMGERVARLQTLVAELAEFIPDCDRERARSAALLCKADLLTGMVGEFPELQGMMGRYYALAEGEAAEVADAIAEHYAPRGPDDRVPTAPVSVALALAEKIDTLVGMFAIGEKPTGSRDPYALRRAALGVIRLVLHHALRLTLRGMFQSTGWLILIRLERQAASNASFPQAGTPLPMYTGATDLYREKAKKVAIELLDFIGDRLKVHLKGEGVPHDQVAAVFALGDDDLVRMLARVRALGEFLKSDDGANLLVAYRRAANIVRIEEKKDQATTSGADYDPALAEAEESALWRALAATESELPALIIAERFAEAMGALARLRRPVDAFFDKVTVNVADAALRRNRLRLLARITAVMNRVADFSRLEG